jgi:ABC-type multidrug transport system ATPase subunit
MARWARTAPARALCSESCSGWSRPTKDGALIFGHDHAIDGSVKTLAGVAGFVDRPHFYPYLTARRTLELLARADGLAEAPIDEVLAFSGLADAAGRKVSGWSTGMLQRLGPATALLRQPRLLILDEPTEGLDPSGSREVIDLLRIVASDGVTVLLCSHVRTTSVTRLSEAMSWSRTTVSAPRSRSEADRTATADCPFQAINRSRTIWPS